MISSISGGAGFEDDGDQRGVAARRLQVAQVLGGHLPAFAGELQEPVLVDRALETVRQRRARSIALSRSDVGEHVLGVGCAGRLAQPEQRAGLGALARSQQAVEPAPVLRRQRRRSAPA